VGGERGVGNDVDVDGTPFGRYRLRELLGRGGMGEVWRAFDTATDRVVAVKLLPVHLADDDVYQQRFRREARAAASLNEPHVVPIHDFGEIDGRLYVDMRLIEGRDLQAILGGGPVEPKRAVGIIDQIASALRAAHRIGLVHRDVKPSNILVTEDDFAYLIDFGIARTAGQTGLTSTGAMVGTWWYMAPERLSGASADARADVYALTCVLHECLTGQPPYPGDSMEQQVTAHLTVEPPKPSTINLAIPAAFDEVIARGMAKDPDERYQTARELADAASQALTVPPKAAASRAEPTLIDPPSAEPAAPTPAPPVSSAAAGRRRWLPIGIVAAVVAATAVGVGIWALRGHGPAPPSASLTAADVDLLKVMPAMGYNRTNCTHQSPTLGADAVLGCQKNVTVGAPSGRFFQFPNVDALTGAYKSVTSVFHATNCPGDPPGPDGPWSVNHKEIGRQACYSDNTVQPAAPSTVITNYNPPVMQVFNWTDPGGPAALAYWWRQGGAMVQPKPGVDPDFFTQSDHDVLNTLNATQYGTANCRHNDPVAPAKAVVACAHNLLAGAPSAQFIAYPNRDTAQAWYRLALNDFAPHSCTGSPGGQDDSWLRQGKPIGRYTCFADRSDRDLPSLMAVDTDTFIGIQFTADAADSPYSLPKTEPALTEWFTKRFGS
jgi:predicted Ser/Thr protein kinase